MYRQSSREPGLIWCKSHGEITVAHGLERTQQFLEVEIG
jgi:hypothetical protein